MKFTKLVAILVLAVTAVVTNTFSQSTSMGIEGGLNLANLSTTPTFNLSSKTGFMVGGFADIGISRIISIKPAVRYIVKGYTQQSQQLQGLSFSGSYSYIEVPLLIKGRVPLNVVKPYIEAGPTVGLQLSASSETTFNGQQIQTSDDGASYNAIDFGLYFGSGVEFRVAPGMDVFTGFGYSLGLINISKTNISVKTNGFQITGGMKFGL